MMASCSPMPSACDLRHQKPQQGSNNNKTILSIIRHDDADPMIMKPPARPSLITTTRRPLFPPRLSIKEGASSSDPVIVNRKQTSASPWLLLNPHIFFSIFTDTVFKFYSLAEDKVLTINRKSLIDDLGLECPPVISLMCKGSSHGWLVLFDSRSWDLFLYNPLSNRHLKLPSIRNLETIIQKDYYRKWGYYHVCKVIISSSDPEGDVNCRALMIHGPSGNQLAFCCPSTSDEWIETYGRYQDVVCAGDNLFFGVSGSQFPEYPEFEGWDLRDVSRPMLISLEDRIVKDFGKRTFPWKVTRGVRQANFLVAACDRQLFYVCLRRSTECRKDAVFHVHKFDFENGKLVHMDRSLDGLALFVGKNHSFALMPAAGDGDVKPDSIYFTHTEDGYLLRYDVPSGREHVEIYNYADGSFSTTDLHCTVRNSVHSHHTTATVCLV